MLANGKIKSIDKYNELVLEFHNIQKIIEDEQRHTEIERSFLIK